MRYNENISQTKTAPPGPRFISEPEKLSAQLDGKKKMLRNSFIPRPQILVVLRGKEKKKKKKKASRPSAYKKAFIKVKPQFSIAGLWSEN